MRDLLLAVAAVFPLAHHGVTGFSPLVRPNAPHTSVRRTTSMIPTPVITASSSGDDSTSASTGTSTTLFGHRVVVTGLGVVSGCGMGHKDFFDACLEGKSSLGPVTRFDASNYPCTIASEVPDDMFDPADYFVNPKNIRTNDRFTHMAVAAARMALKDGKMGDTADTLEVDADSIGVMVGTAFGGMETFEQETLKLAKKPERPKVSPFTIPALLGNTASGVIAIETGCKGPNYGVTSACASGSHAIGEAMGMIADGHVKAMLAGGTEATITPLCFAGFCAMKAMATGYNDNPTGGSRPFDANRGGFVMGEGAGVVLLESLESALERGAPIYCEVAGYGATCDAHHITTPAPEGQGLAKAMTMALDMSGMASTDVHYVNAHGTSTNYNDKFETMAIKTALGEEHAKSKNFVVSSTKCVTGHTLGAAGGLEAIVVARAIQDGVIPPTINYETPDPECDLDVVPNVKREMPSINGAMSTNLGFGGHNAALLFKKYVP